MEKDHEARPRAMPTRSVRTCCLSSSTERYILMSSHSRHASFLVNDLR